MLDGLNSDGAVQLSVGMLVKSNPPDSEVGDYGTLRLQWNIVEDDTSPTGFSMEASGNTQLNFGGEDIYLRLEMVPEKNISYNDRDPVMHIDARMLSYFRDASHGVAKLLTPWYYIAGSGDTSGINLYSNTVKTSSADHSFSTKQGPGSLLTDPKVESEALAATHLPAGADPFEAADELRLTFGRPAKLAVLIIRRVSCGLRIAEWECYHAFVERGLKLQVLDGTCVYMMGGLNADGEKARSIGMLIKSNLPDSELGDYGTLKLQWNIVEGDTSPTGFSMEASGGTQLSLGTDEVSLRLALGPNDIVTFDDNEG
ncbi:hypothetical protein FOL46_006467 [Perkinsus olseni]|uniref:Uncharacterized protein n=1 Tax=Perkinsus olseni TaxID=32597 RepID=A0A7J6MR00_PEROL|nr:hypothetical protein FOL46_006467 [Perkinsus olseni]